MDVSVECRWLFREGRDSEGEKYALHMLVHGSGRVFAKVHEVRGCFRADFYFVCSKELLDTSEPYDFIDLDSAKRFAEESVAKCDPLAPPKPKRMRKATTPVG